MASRGALTGAKVAMAALNLVMKANPVGLVISAIAGLVAGLTWFFTQTEVGRQAWASFVSWLGSAWTWLSGAASSAWSAITSGVSAAASWVSGAWSGTVSAVTGAWNGVVGFFTGLWSSISGGAQAGWSALRNVVSTGLNAILPVITAPLKIWGTLFKAAWDTIKTVVAAGFLILHAVFTGNFGAIRGIVDAAWSKIRSIFSGALSSIRSTVTGAWNAIKTIFSGAWAGLKTIVSGGITAIVGFVAALPGKVASAASSLAAKLREKITAAWTAAKEAVRTGIAAVVDLVRTLPDKAKAALGSIGSKLLSAGQDLVRGFVNGIKAGLSWVTNAARDLANSAVNAAKSALGIASPSKVFRKKIGQQIGKGLALGIGDGLPEVRDAIAKLSKETIKLSDKAIAAESKRIREARKKENDQIRAWNKNRGKGVKARSLLPSISATEATKLAKKNLSGASADLKRANEIVKAQSKLTKTLWDDGKYKGAVERWVGLNKGTVALLQGLTASGKVRKDATKAVKGATLADIAKAQGQITAAIDAAKATLKDMKAASAQLAASVSQSLSGELDLRSLVGDDLPAPTFETVQATVAGLAAKVKRFAGLLKDLAGKGIPPGLIQEVAALGTAAGIPVAQALASGSASQVKSLAGDWAALGSWSDKAGKTVADSMFLVGIQAQQGLIDGLKKDSAKLEAAATVLTDKVVKAAKKALGIKSPSRVMKAVGGFAVEGLRLAIDAGRGVVAAAAARLGDAAVPEVTYGADVLADWASARIQAETTWTPPSLPTAADMALNVPDQGPTRLAREDLELLANLLIGGLWRTARAAETVEDMAANGPNRARRGSVRGGRV
ncbi:MAG: hypothetical protein IPJ61_17580 [Tessaracoccus sp.]|uniref:phage tail protein n=1 Tax=Tessaracoccus sp. TaxID=1971211 RepID=UPI001ED5E186|nr:hypothetical protein [Tessaracoccus sp.]MBK7822817.1 hypothetical protein [Tessaracoccus sp.]